jgi:hypothetical protein
VLIVLATQTIVQSCYFVGLIARALFTSDHHTRPIL